MFKRFFLALISSLIILSCAGCDHRPDPDTVVMIIESSPASLDPRVGTDAQSERINKLLFDSLLKRDEHFNVQPSLAERWGNPDPLTYIFHLRPNVRFHDGSPLTSRDVKWTLDSVSNGSVVSAKASTYQHIASVETPDDQTVVIHLKEPYATLLWSLSEGSIGIVPYGSGKELGRHPIGSGPFQFVSEEQDNYLLITRNEHYWGEHAHVRNIRFAVVPETTTRALELRKGSSDIEINALPPDMVGALKKDPALRVETSPGSVYTYLALNLRDPILKDVRVRQAIAYAIDRKSMVHFLWDDTASLSNGLLPRQHWAYDPEVRVYDYDPAQSRKLLDEAGYARVHGIRFHLLMKTSTEETTRLLAAVLQQQLRAVGIALDIRSFEFATFYSDVVKGAFQMYSLRWIGDNEDPGIFEHVFHSASFPPKRANRSFYVNPQVDSWIDSARQEPDQEKRKQLYFHIQQTVANDLPYISLWYQDNVIVHTARVSNLRPSASGNYDFLKTVELTH